MNTAFLAISPFGFTWSNLRSKNYHFLENAYFWTNFFPNFVYFNQNLSEFLTSFFKNTLNWIRNKEVFCEKKVLKNMHSMRKKLTFSFFHAPISFVISKILFSQGFKCDFVRVFFFNYSAWSYQKNFIVEGRWRSVTVGEGQWWTVKDDDGRLCNGVGR